MSSSQWKASFATQSDTFYWITWNTENGFPEDVPLLQQEELTANGTDFSRFRDLRYAYVPWWADVMADALSLDAAYAQRAAWKEAVRQVGVLSVNLGGLLYKFRNCKLLAVDNARPDPAQVVGFGATPNNTAWLRARLTFQFVGDPS